MSQADGAAEARAVRLFQRLMLRSGRGLLRPLWRTCYEAVLLGLAVYLRPGRSSSVYTTGSLGAGDAVYGLSDFDILVVLSEAPGRVASRRRRIERRWSALTARMPYQSAHMFDVAVCDEGHLRDVLTGSPFTYGLRRAGSHPAERAAYFGSGARRGLILRERPGPRKPLSDWRRIRGSLELPAVPEPRVDERRSAAWLELQWWWRYAFGLCVDPSGPYAAHLCLKLISEPVRAWLWLADGVQPTSRRDALRHGLRALPEEEAALGLGLELDRDLHLRPDPPVAEAVAALARLSTRIARRLAHDASRAGWRPVRLIGEDLEPALTVDARALAAGLGASARSRPMALVDWRALVTPRLPDEVFVRLDGQPADPSAVAAAANVAGAAVCPVLASPDLHVLPTTEPVREGILRAAQCQVTDPVSFALASGRAEARFPELAGWSARDSAARAVAEHGAWLVAPGPPCRAFLDVGPVPGDVLTTARLLTAARAAMFQESLQEGVAELPVTLATVADRLRARVSDPHGMVEESYRHYRAWQTNEPSGDRPPNEGLRVLVMNLRAYSALSGDG